MPTTSAPAPAPAQIAAASFEALQKKDLDTALSVVTEDSVDEFLAVGTFRGHRAIRGFFEELLAAFPDFEVTVERVVGDDTVAVVQWRAGGTFSGGTFQGIEPTGNHAEIRGVDVIEYEDGKVAHNTIYYDGASFARQVGMLPRSGSALDKALLHLFNLVTVLRRKARSRSSA